VGGQRQDVHHRGGSRCTFWKSYARANPRNEASDVEVTHKRQEAEAFSGRQEVGEDKATAWYTVLSHNC
jgi:hypothetical protein